MIRHTLKLIWNRKRQNALLILEIFLAFLILFSVMTFVFYNLDLYRTPLGFDTEQIWIARLSPPSEVDSVQKYAVRQRLLTTLGSFPEIEEVAFSNHVTPFSGSAWSTTTDDNGFELRSYIVYADEHFARTIGLKLIEGRWFEEADKQLKYPPIVINQKLRDAYFKDTNVVNLDIQFNGDKRIIGVVDHYKYYGEFEEENNLSFEFYDTNPDLGPALILRIRPGTEAAFEEQVNRTIKNIAKDWNFVIKPLENERKRTSQDTWIPIIATLSISGFLIFNVALGLFGVLMYNINKRRPEIGLRRAVGAAPNSIIGQFVLEMLLLTSLGLVLGVFFAVQLPIMQVFPIENAIYFSAILASIGIIFTLVLVCTLYPSVQASFIHPATALHEE